MGDKCNCYRFSPRDSLSGAVAQIADYLSKHPGWNETELKAFVDGLISSAGVETFNGRSGNVTLNKDDVNNLLIANCYFAEADETIESIDVLALYKLGIRIVFTQYSSEVDAYTLAYAIEYYPATDTAKAYLFSSGSGGGTGNIVSVNGKTGAVNLKVVDVSKGNSPDENAYIFIDESDDYPDVVSSDSNKLGGQLPSYYATAEEVSKLKSDIVNNSGFKMDLLWTNASPTSAFDNQRITLDSLYNYNYIVIYYLLNSGYPRGNSNLVIRNNSFIHSLSNPYSTDSYYNRSGIFSDNYVDFDVCSGADYMIPYKIYGVK